MQHQGDLPAPLTLLNNQGVSAGEWIMGMGVPHSLISDLLVSAVICRKNKAPSKAKAGYDCRNNNSGKGRLGKRSLVKVSHGIIGHPSRPGSVNQEAQEGFMRFCHLIAETEYIQADLTMRVSVVACLSFSLKTWTIEARKPF